MAHPTDRPHYAKVTTQASEFDSDLTDFPMPWDLSLITDQTWWDNIKSDGGDLMVYTEAGTRVAVELDNLDTVAKTGWIHWLSSPSSTVNQEWRLWVGEASAAQPARDAAFGLEAVYPNCKGAWNLGEEVNNDAGGYADSTSNNNDGTGVSMAITAPAGKIGIGAEMDGAADSIGMGNPASLSFTTAFTVSAWIYHTGGSGEVIFGKADPGGGDGWFLFLSGSPLKIYLQSGNGIWTNGNAIGATAIAANTWLHVSARFNGSEITVYLNGASDGSDLSVGTITETTNEFEIGGHQAASGNAFDGIIDTVSVTNTDLGADWLLAEYDSQNAPGTSNVYGGVFAAAAFRNRIMSVA